ncbi:hypothetical protein WT27_14825 [Burkholderia territorii]|uniref:Uncharacterized protein n=1 Tax=Burkholderia territorii TaxID=1503055 RepID=A0A106DBR3_9BURK|nr:hypothetical protein [Burkholderia territorii]KVV39195.1 hypothetical protein WT27_14825 [Burkholderia territorii]KVX26256.1 hypothetical protein WT31_16750 [Burkholderia territorii]
MASIGAIAQVMSGIQDKVANDMQQKAEALKGKTNLDQKDLNDLQVATELVKAVNQATQGAISAVGDGMTAAARGINR